MMVRIPNARPNDVKKLVWLISYSSLIGLWVMLIEVFPWRDRLRYIQWSWLSLMLLGSGFQMSMAIAEPCCRQDHAQSIMIAQSALLLLPLSPAESTLQNQPELAPHTPPPQHLTPYSPPQPLPNHQFNKIGLITQMTPTRMTIRSINGNEKTHAISPQLSAAPSMTRGSLVAYRLNQSKITEIEIPVVRSVFEGVVIVMENDVLGLVSAAGERKLTTLSSSKIDALNLVPGQKLRVIEFEGLQTKVICTPAQGQRSPIYIGEIEGDLYNFQ